jgi:3-oxoacyl-[acyl-carrier-protein] synthase II
MRTGWFAPTVNLDCVGPECASLDHLTGEGRAVDLKCVMSNNFAFGGPKMSQIFRRPG